MLEKPSEERGLEAGGLARGAAASASGGAGAESDLASTLLRRLSERGPAAPRYESEDELAQGGQGRILRVRDEDLGRHLAMKVSHELHSTATPKGARRISRFLEEARLTAQLDHPGIVPVHDLGLDDDGRLFFTMKLVKGRDLKEIFKLVAIGAEGWTRTRALSVLLRVCEGMAYAHAKGVIHRDLKPGNVMVGRFGEVYVMDWGLARVLDRPDSKDIRIQRRVQEPMLTTQVDSLRHASSVEADDALVTMDGDVVGTPAYMPPEQASGDLDAIGPHSDVYSAGAMLYHLWAGHPPYLPPNARPNNYAIWSRVQEGPPTPVHERAPEMPAELVAICERAMAREPSQRYRDMSELAEDLRAYLEHRVVHAYETGAVAELRKWVARNRALAASIAAGLVMAIGGLSSVSYVQARERKEADKQRNLARESEAQARSSAEEARHLELVAKTQRDNVLRLSAFQQLEDLRRNAAELWPARPALIERYEDWLQDARRVVAGLDADLSHGYAGHHATLAALRERALPQSEAERRAAIEAHSRRAELVALRARTKALRSALEVAAGRAPVPEAAVPEELARAAADVLNQEAWKRVDPDRHEFGQEAEGLSLALSAIDRAGDRALLALVGDTLAWALFANGLDEEALAASENALAEAGPGRRQEFTGYRERLRRAIAARAEQGAERLAALERRCETLEWSLSGFRFREDEDAWWFTQLAQLIEEVEALAEPRDGLMGDGVSPRHGWGIARRLAFARSIGEQSVTGAVASASWAEASASIADPRECPHYEGLRLAPQLGLLPCGRDSGSGLWEFVDLQTGDAPVRDVEGRLHLSEASGLVFVLIPGGGFLMGAQSEDPGAPGYDSEASPLESPPHWVEVAPFLLSKYEMTQAQWQRFTGLNPSFYRPSNEPTVKSLLHPVESVSWDECREVLARLGLQLPQEAQWEYAVRAGTESAWWTGDDVASLAGRANVYDRSYARADPNRNPADVSGLELDDGYVAHAPVDILGANPYGLFGVIGNLFEWCHDAFSRDAYERVERGELLPEEPGLDRVARGGSYNMKPHLARSSCRFHYAPALRQHVIGVRPARGIE